MKSFPFCFCVTLGMVALSFSGCVNSEGRIRPPDPLGRALFDALDPGPRYTESDARYVGQPQSQASGNVWVDGAWGRDARGQRVWIPGHWAYGEVR